MTPGRAAPWLDGAVLAVTTFTVVPIRGLRTATPRAMGVAMLLAPAIGAGLGIVAGGVGAGLRSAASPLVAAAVVVALLALLTRGLHLDGLADTADGLASYRPREAALGIMREGAVGPLGVVALVLVLLLDVASLATVRHLLAAIVVAAATGRLTALLATTARTPSARDQGLGAAVAGTVSERAAWAVTALVAVPTIAIWAALEGVSGALLAVLALVVALGVAEGLRWHAVRRLGGITGDVLGGLVEISTCLVLLVLTTAR